LVISSPLLNIAYLLAIKVDKAYQKTSAYQAICKVPIRLHSENQNKFGIPET